MSPPRRPLSMTAWDCVILRLTPKPRDWSFWCGYPCIHNFIAPMYSSGCQPTWSVYTHVLLVFRKSISLHRYILCREFPDWWLYETSICNNTPSIESYTLYFKALFIHFFVYQCIICECFWIVWVGITSIIVLPFLSFSAKVCNFVLEKIVVVVYHLYSSENRLYYFHLCLYEHSCHCWWSERSILKCVGQGKIAHYRRLWCLFYQRYLFDWSEIRLLCNSCHEI